jgi:hypothetical protein
MEQQNISENNNLQFGPHKDLLTVDMLLNGYEKYGIGWLQQTMDGLLAARSSKEFMNSLTTEQAKDYMEQQAKRNGTL